MIDLSGMKSIRVDAEAGLAEVDAGLTLVEVDAATQAHGLAVPVASTRRPGIAGLTLGGVAR